MAESDNAWNVGSAGRLIMGHGGTRCMMAGERRSGWPCSSTRVGRGECGALLVVAVTPSVTWVRENGGAVVIDAG